MVTAVIVDDEKKSREVLLRLITEINANIKIIAQGDSVEEGFNIIKKHQPNIVFLDVEMLDGTGFNLLEKFVSVDFEIIFTTAYDDYAIKAFKYSAIDYLLKPINIDELENAIHKAKTTINNKIDNAAQVAALLNNINNESKNKKITIKGATKINFINMKYCFL